MAIKFKNLAEFTRGFGVNGNISTGVKLQFLIPYACQLKSVIRRARTAGTTSTESIDILKNNTSIFSGSVRVDSPTTSVSATTLGAMTTNPPTFAKGDSVVFNVIAVNTTPAVDVSFEACFQRVRGTGPVGAVQLDSAVGVEAE